MMDACPLCAICSLCYSVLRFIFLGLTYFLVVCWLISILPVVIMLKCTRNGKKIECILTVHFDNSVQMSSKFTARFDSSASKFGSLTRALQYTGSKLQLYYLLL